MQSSQNFTLLGTALSNTFTVYIPDRRGRGLSGPFGPNYGLQSETEDLEALLAVAGTHNVFGLSSGAVIALHAATRLSAIRKLALFEPPLDIDGEPSPASWVPEYERYLSKGNLAGAMIANIRGIGDRSLFFKLPRFILEPLLASAIRADNKKGGTDGQTLQALIPTVHFDTQLIAEMAGRLDRFKTMQTTTLLMCGQKSPASLIAPVNALSHVLPRCERVEFAGLDHLAPDNTGTPEPVAEALRRFFS